MGDLYSLFVYFFVDFFTFSQWGCVTSIIKNSLQTVQSNFIAHISHTYFFCSGVGSDLRAPLPFKGWVLAMKLNDSHLVPLPYL